MARIREEKHMRFQVQQMARARSMVVFRSWSFQKKHWFDSRITRRYLLDLKARYPGQLIGILIWDSAPSHKDTASIEFLKQAEDDGWLKVVRVPGGITSVVQVGDIACNGPLKKRVKALYGKWRSAQIREIQEKNNSTRYTGNEKFSSCRETR